ncbi:AMP nucleosidase [Thiotrichales bacterium 19S11-10]|nr:AMP nucleosidase [Thiotrichales bacterium 19S11-10]MCF6806845.1 AMP nucleosidase [Thiotrichales bacterium 19S9-11]MCF6810814.1 AMP nucleosidase [Thiotrichales bacterium 19S9-12]
MKTKLQIASDWLPRYTGMPLKNFGEYILLTNFRAYLDQFAERFNSKIFGDALPMQATTNEHGVTMINFGMGSPNTATILDLLTAVSPKAVLLLGKCGGIKKSTEIGHFILPIAAVRGDGTSNDYMLPEVPALPSFKLHKFISEKLYEQQLEYRTGVIYTTNRRVWEWDESFKDYLKKLSVIGIDMETATLFIVGHANHIPRGALLLVSDLPMTPEGVKTSRLDKSTNQKYTDLHLDLGIQAMMDIGKNDEFLKHYHY